jgi:hypothetical protein
VSASPGAERWAVAALDHFAGLAGFQPVADARPANGGWRRLYVRDGAEGVMSAVGSDAGRFVSLGVEIEAARDVVRRSAHDLATALAAYEVAVDPDAGADPASPDAVVRVALRLFLEGLTASVVRDACGNLAAAAAEARRVLGVTSGPGS